MNQVEEHLKDARVRNKNVRTQEGDVQREKLPERARTTYHAMSRGKRTPQQTVWKRKRKVLTTYPTRPMRR